MFEENEDPRNLDSIWNDIEEYEIPETTFNNVTGDYINALTVKIVSATNHYSLLCQYPGDRYHHYACLRPALAHADHGRYL